MKNITDILIITILLAAIIAGCRKTAAGIPTSLNGTTWAMSHVSDTERIINGTIIWGASFAVTKTTGGYYYIITFADCQYTVTSYTQYPTVYATGIGSYTYADGVVTSSTVGGIDSIRITGPSTGVSIYSRPLSISGDTILSGITTFTKL